MNSLIAYINNPNNDLLNFNLALDYESKEHYSPALSFLLRCAERTNDLNLRYECILKMYICYEKLGGRDITCETLLKQAITIQPKKPEAYFFLGLYYEKKSDWINMYTNASIAVEFCDEKSIFLSSISFPGKYVLLLQKAISAYNVGKPTESREIYQILLNNYINTISDEYKIILKNNLYKLGSGPEHICIRKYDKNSKYRLKFSFDGIDNIEQNYSQVYQDMMALYLFNGKNNGTYLEIGASEPFKNNNTALLEKKFNWVGVGIEHNQDLVNYYNNNRSNPAICSDALIIDYNKLLKKYFPNTTVIDYLQLDIEPPEYTYEALLSIPFNNYKFGFITYEHDYYVDITRSYKNKSREYLSNLGYTLLVPNVAPTNISPFEDWWVHPDLIDSSKIDLIQKNILNQEINQIDTFFLYS